MLAALAFIATPVIAQDSATAKAPSKGCFVARDATRCRTYMITELTIADGVALTDNAHPKAFNDRGQLAIGQAWNRQNRASLGWAATFEISSTGGFSGVEARYRRWLGKTPFAIEQHAGYLYMEVLLPPSPAYVGGHGVRTSTALVLGPYLNAFTRFEAVKARGQLHSGILAGAGVTSHGTSAAVLAGTLAVLYIFTALAIGGEGAGS